MAKKATADNLVKNVLDFGTGLFKVGANIVANAPSIINEKPRGGNVEVFDVLNILKNIVITDSQYTTEKNIEKIIATILDSKYLVHRQYNMEGFLGLKIDIDINECVGVELKMAKELNTSNIERLLGQVLYYSKRKYKSKLIVVIVGKEKEENQRKIEELQKIIEEQGVTFYFLKTMKSRPKL